MSSLKVRNIGLQRVRVADLEDAPFNPRGGLKPGRFQADTAGEPRYAEDPETLIAEILAERK